MARDLPGSIDEILAAQDARLAQLAADLAADDAAQAEAGDGTFDLAEAEADSTPALTTADWDRAGWAIAASATYADTLGDRTDSPATDVAAADQRAQLAGATVESYRLLDAAIMASPQVTVDTSFTITGNGGDDLPPSPRPLRSARAASAGFRRPATSATNTFVSGQNWPKVAPLGRRR